MPLTEEDYVLAFLTKARSIFEPADKKMGFLPLGIFQGDLERLGCIGILDFIGITPERYLAENGRYGPDMNFWQLSPRDVCKFGCEALIDHFRLRDGMHDECDDFLPRPNRQSDFESIASRAQTLETKVQRHGV